MKHCEVFSSGPYSVTVPYRQQGTITELVKTGRYAWVDARITDDHFPLEEEGDREVVIELLHFDRDVPVEVAVGELRSRNLQPANVAEVLAFSNQCPVNARGLPLIALGQVWRLNQTRQFVVYVASVCGQKEALLYWCGSRENIGIHFAGVCVVD